MAKIKIFVEGVEDYSFIRGFIKYHYRKDLERGALKDKKTQNFKNGDIISLGGVNQINNLDNIRLLAPILAMNNGQGITNLLILDADETDQGSGFTVRENEIRQIIQEHNLLFDKFFLFPNHEHDGCLEDLLKQCINTKNQAIFDCWDTYESCLTRIQIEGRPTPLTTPLKKARINAYLSALLAPSNSQQNKVKDFNRDYCNVDHWNLDSSVLDRLKQFLDLYFNYEE